MTYRTYSPRTGCPGLDKKIRDGDVYKEYPDGEWVKREVDIEPEEQENEND